MKIAFFTDTFLPQINGVTNTLSRLFKYLDRNGIEYIVFAPDQKDDIYLDYNVELSHSIRFFLYPECRISIPNANKIQKTLEEFKPDLIHVVTEFSMGISGITHAIANDIPVVSSYHTNFDFYLKHYNCEFLSTFYWQYMRWFHNLCLLNLGPSQDTKQHLIKNGIKNVGVWGRGINAELFSPKFNSIEKRRELGLKEDTIALLYVGRIALEKNIDILIDSYKILKEKFGDKISLILTGDGPMLKSLKKDNEDIIFTGYKSGDELATIYACCDIFTFPSASETFGNVVLESMASGVPVVGVRSGGVRNIIDPGKTGLLCEPHNIESFTKEISELISNDFLRKQLGSQAYEYSTTQSWTKIFGKLTDDYAEVLNNAPSKSQKLLPYTKDYIVSFFQSKRLLQNKKSNIQY